MKPFRKFKVAVIGCGMISDTYLTNLCTGEGAKGLFKVIEVVGCSDIVPERSKAKSEKYNIRQMTNEEIFADPEIDIVLNLTYHTSHYEVTRKSLEAGKHVYSEKMIAPSFAEGKELYDLAKSKGLMLCAAPDTFLGSGMQTARCVVDGGFIGTPVAGNAAVTRSYHHERFRADPERRFAFCPGGGIMFDMGCYYFASLINLLGPIKRVCGFSQTRAANERVFANPDNPEYGKVMKIESPNNVAGVLEFENGCLVTMTTTSEVSNAPQRFVIYGSEGELNLTDPNEFSGDTRLRTKTGEQNVIPSNHAYKDNCRGMGLADMCYAIANGREPRASGERALHMLEAADAIMGIANGGMSTVYTMTTTCTRPAPLEKGITEFPEMVFDI